MRNFFDLYRIHADTWEVYDNTDSDKQLIAIRSCEEEYIGNQSLWADFQRSADHD